MTITSPVLPPGQAVPDRAVSATMSPSEGLAMEAAVGRYRSILTPEVLAKIQQLDAAAARRQKAEDELETASAECRALVVELLKLGVPRAELVDRPFSNAWLSKIQREEGLARSRRESDD